jgi:hypothetical protein
MRPHPHPPTAYRCILPVYHPSLDSQPNRSPQELSYPAWPCIDDPNRPCYLPTLPGARYFVHRSTGVDPETAAARANTYLSRQEAIERGIREQAQAFVKAQNTFWRHLPNVTRYPPILFAPGDLGLIREAGLSGGEVLEAGMQALIEGNRANFYGPEVEAFAFGHEYAHDLARLFASGRVLDNLSEFSQGVLFALATFRLPPEQIPELWEKFQENNAEIQRLAQKFEPVEEIFATYVGLRFSPIAVRNKVIPLIKAELEKRNWAEAYEMFAEVCDNFGSPFDTAFLIYEPVCRMIERLDYRGIDIDSMKLLCTFMEIQILIWSNSFKIQENENDVDELKVEEILEIEAVAQKEAAEEINHILEQARIPQDIYWAVSSMVREKVISQLKHLQEAIFNDGVSHKERKDHQHCARITLIGRPSQKEIAIFVNYCEEEYKRLPYKMSPFDRIFFESLRQQLCQFCDEEGVTIVCPYALAYKGKCCGRKEALLRLYELLPQEARKRFTLPDCARVH